MVRVMHHSPQPFPPLGVRTQHVKHNSESTRGKPSQARGGEEARVWLAVCEGQGWGLSQTEPEASSQDCPGLGPLG